MENRHTLTAHNRSQIPCHPLKNYKKNYGNSVSSIFSTQSTYSYRNISFRVSRSKSSVLRNSDRIIFNLSLSRYNANFSNLDARNLQESIKFYTSFLLLIFSTVNMFCKIIKEIYIFFFSYRKYIYTSFTRGDYFFDDKMRVV